MPATPPAPRPAIVLLSGGLDSAIVAAVAAKVAAEKGEKLPTFAVGTEHSADLLAARAVAEYLGTDHHEIVPSAEDLAAALDLNRNTVLRAYRDLRDDGLVELRRGRGATAIRPREEMEEGVEKQLDALAAALTSALRST